MARYKGVGSFAYRWKSSFFYKGEGEGFVQVLGPPSLNADLKNELRLAELRIDNLFVLFLWY